MVDQLSETEILDYLMSSEFEEGLTPDEFKFLLKKFRNFYRIVSCSLGNQKDKMEEAIQSAKLTEDRMRDLSDDYENRIAQLEKDLQQITNKKLTWQERFKGKIIQ